MPYSISKEIERGMELLNEGKLEEAWNLIIRIEKIEMLTREMHLRFQFLKTTVLLYLGKFKATLKITEFSIFRRLY